jgi:hypothetical protein
MFVAVVRPSRPCGDVVPGAPVEKQHCWRHLAVTHSCLCDLRLQAMLPEYTSSPGVEVSLGFEEAIDLHLNNATYIGVKQPQGVFSMRQLV